MGRTRWYATDTPVENRINRPPPNKPMQLTPLRVPEILAFLKPRIGQSSSRSISGGATDGQAVRRITAIAQTSYCASMRPPTIL